MYERKMRNNPAPCYLLMSAKRHLPGREGNKNDPASRQITFHTGQELGFGFDMFNYIVYKD